MGPSGLGGARAHFPPPPRIHHWDGAPRMGGKGTKKGGGAPRRGEGGLSTVFNLMGLKHCNILLLVFTFTTTTGVGIYIDFNNLRCASEYNTERNR